MRAVAIATGRDYQEVYDRVNELAKRERTGKRKRGRSSARNGVYKDTSRKLCEAFGLVWVSTMAIGSGCKVHVRPDELPVGTLVLNLSRHFTAVRVFGSDQGNYGTIHDTHNPDRDGTRCVYGYWTHR